MDIREDGAMWVGLSSNGKNSCLKIGLKVFHYGLSKNNNNLLIFLLNFFNEAVAVSLLNIKPSCRFNVVTVTKNHSGHNNLLVYHVCLL